MSQVTGRLGGRNILETERALTQYRHNEPSKLLRVSHQRNSRNLRLSMRYLHVTRQNNAPASTSAASANAARIFDSSPIDNAMPMCIGAIPLSPQDPRFQEQCYWRIPVPADAILAAFIAQLPADKSQCTAVKLARFISVSIEMKMIEAAEESADDNAPGPSNARRGGPRGGRRGGGRGRDGRGGGGGRGGRDKNMGNKRKDPDDNQGSSKGKKPRKATGRNLGERLCYFSQLYCNVNFVFRACQRLYRISELPTPQPTHRVDGCAC